jgi:hypothetical protein
MRSNRRFAAVAVVWVLAAPATAPAGPFGTNLYFDVDAPQPLRPPKPGEYLGEYLVADYMPCQARPLAGPRPLPELLTPLPPHEERFDRGVWHSGPLGWDQLRERAERAEWYGPGREHPSIARPRRASA